MVADRLFQKLLITANIVEVEAKKDIDDFIFVELNSF